MSEKLDTKAEKSTGVIQGNISVGRDLTLKVQHNYFIPILIIIIVVSVFFVAYFLLNKQDTNQITEEKTIPIIKQKELKKEEKTTQTEKLKPTSLNAAPSGFVINNLSEDNIMSKTLKEKLTKLIKTYNLIPHNHSTEFKNVFDFSFDLETIEHTKEIGMLIEEQIQFNLKIIVRNQASGKLIVNEVWESKKYQIHQEEDIADAFTIWIQSIDLKTITNLSNIQKTI